MTQAGKKTYFIFTDGIRKLALIPIEAMVLGWNGWERNVIKITKLEADNINDNDLFHVEQ